VIDRNTGAKRIHYSRSVRILMLSMAVMLLMNTASCGQRKVSRYEATFLQLFDTKTTIVAYTDDKKEFEKYSRLIYDKLNEYHQLYDIYNNYDGINNLKTVNDNAGRSPVKVDKRIIDLLQFSKQWYEKTGGKVNVAFGSVLRIWHDYRQRGIDDPDSAQLPPMDMLEEAARHTDINRIIINEEESTVYLEDPEMSIDVGSIAKGYATEQVSRIAAEAGFTSGLISVGGNVRAIGTKKAGAEQWNVGIQNPEESEDMPNLHILNISDASLVTSGIYERYYTVGGINYHHIIDPDTLFPSTGYKSVSILCRDSGIADALSTAVFNMDIGDGMKFIESLDGVEAFWVLDSGEFKYSSHFADYIKEH
jgi:thiamine biosynthesis lipoprotein